jgi:hypothetical protein
MKFGAAGLIAISKLAASNAQKLDSFCMTAVDFEANR